MRALVEFIGWMFLLACLAGALIPGFHCHFAVAGDKSMLRWHKRNAAEIEARLAQAQLQKELQDGR